MRLLTSAFLVAGVAANNNIARECKCKKDRRVEDTRYLTFVPLPLVMFEFSWPFGYGGFALYLVGIAQTLADVCREKTKFSERGNVLTCGFC